ncbi:MAG TPA: adenylate/guanylate cyclase domain-containing protein [Gaiellaceae bacterium]|nr:adenylate/guanylate cyclase domain-containing protein [Gaiellaceae bacterium]
MPELPTGTVTLLFTDIDGSTKLLQALGPKRYVGALDAHRRLLREACAAHGGVEVEMQGDSFHFAFGSARAAAEAAAAAQRAHAGHEWPGEPVRVRIGLHTGEPVAHGELFAGLDVHRAARIMGTAEGGEVLVSQTTRDLLAGEFELRDLGERQLKDLSAPERIYALVVEDGRPVEPAEPVREERKLVSVLVAELVGLSASDPEDFRASLEPFQARAQKEIERFGGSVEKLVGEEVMAFFGIPLAHDDDPERAVRAGLAIRETIREDAEDLQVCIGITTGEALARLGARTETGDLSASGDVINAAARLQAAAGADAILVDETTYRATERAIDYGEATSVQLKVTAESQPAWEALAVHLGLDIRQLGPLVGRDRDLASLVAAVTRVREEREPQLVTLVGVPGIGKSRLVFELFGALEQEPELFSWLQGRSLPYGEGVSFWALAEIVKDQAGILESDDAESSATKLLDAIESHVADPTEVVWLERHLRPLVGLQADQELSGSREEAFAAWRRFLEVLAEPRPLVAVFEDLHFADEGLLDFVDHLVEWASGVPLLVLCTARPELIARREAWGGGKVNSTTISLPPLSDDETAHLVHALLEQPLLDAEFQSTLISRAGGNPLYAEEFARLVGEGRQVEELPESVQGIIAARLDALPEDEKELIQDAAVLGKVFWLGALTQMAGHERGGAERGLHALERKEFLRRERSSSVAGESEYSFGHLLVRDVAYGQIPRARRADKHRLAAEWIEALGRPDDQAELVVHHYLAALELARAARQPLDELETSARLALRDAGEHAEALNAFIPARGYFQAALELWPLDDSERPRLLFAYGKTLVITEQSGDEVLREASDALHTVGDRETAAEAEVLLAELALYRGDRAYADELLHRVAGLIQGAGDSRSKALVLSSLSRFRMLADEYQEAILLGRQALELAERFGLEEIRAHALDNVGVARVNLGDAGGIADLERSIEIALAASSRECVRAYMNLGQAFWVLGDRRRSSRAEEEGLTAAQRFGGMGIMRGLRANMMENDFVAGRWDEAFRLADEFIAETEAGSPHFYEGTPRYIRGAIRLARGDTVGGLADAERGLEVAKGARASIYGPSLAFYAEALLACGRAEEAKTIALEALALAGENAVVFAGCWPVLIRVLAALGLGEELLAVTEAAPPTRWIEATRLYAGGDFAGAAELYAQIGSLLDEADARLRAAELLAEAGEREEAAVQLDQALSFYRFVGATRYVDESEALRAASA